MTCGDTPAAADACAGRRKSCDNTRCTLLRNVCLINATLVVKHENAWRPLSMKVRVPWASHAMVELAELNNDSLARVDLRRLDRALLAATDTECDPAIAFVPTWSVNFAETFLGTAVPLLELAAPHLRVLRHLNSTRLIVDVLHQHMHHGCRTDVNGPCMTPAWFEAVVGPIAPLRFLHHAAPPLSATAPNDSPPECYTHMRSCSLRSTFDKQPAKLDVWAAGQRFAGLVLGRNTSLASEAESPRDGENDVRVLRVVFEKRVLRRAMARRAIYNIDALLLRCASENETWAGFPPIANESSFGGGCSGSRKCYKDAEARQAFILANRVRLVCSTHTFGALGLAADIQLVREADVLVGMHGAGLTHAYFMRRRSVVVEVRPFGFEGSWPDYYFRHQLVRMVSPPRVFHLHLAIGDPELCHPNRGFSVIPQEASYASGCTLPWGAIKRVLLRAAYWKFGARPYTERGTRRPTMGGGIETPEQRYSGSAHYSKVVVAYKE